jgi:hypothetical protein
MVLYGLGVRFTSNNPDRIRMFPSSLSVCALPLSMWDTLFGLGLLRSLLLRAHSNDGSPRWGLHEESVTRSPHFGHARRWCSLRCSRYCYYLGSDSGLRFWLDIFPHSDVLSLFSPSQEQNFQSLATPLSPSAFRFCGCFFSPNLVRMLALS